MTNKNNGKLNKNTNDMRVVTNIWSSMKLNKR